jgi:hypothetical protein
MQGKMTPEMQKMMKEGEKMMKEGMCMMKQAAMKSAKMPPKRPMMKGKK